MTDYPLSALAASLAPDPDLPVDVWADTYQVIPKDSGANEYGKFRTSRTPHARMVMQALSDHHPCKRVVLMGASQMLKTQTGLNWLMASIHQSPANFLWILPTGKLAKRASTRIAKNIAAVPEVAERVATPRSRDSVNTLDTKEYIGGALFIVTAGAAANLSEVPARRVLFDEVDRAELNVNGEGDPVALAEARQTTFERNRKSYFPSSPTIRDESIVERLYLRGTQRQALAECLHCGELQPLEFERLIATDDGQGALYPCMHCGGIHTESDKPRMFARGAWSDGVGGDGETESFQISGMFLPYGWLPWVALLREYKKAKDKLDEGSEEAMIAFYNTRLARSWERQKEQTKADELMARAEPYKLGTAPAGVMRLTAAVDTQADRLELLVVGWGRWLEAWVIDYQIVRGDPSDPQTWARLDALLQTRYPHAFGQTLPIAAAFVDSGGNATQEVYSYTRTKRHRHIFSIKGASRPGRPILSSKPSTVEVRANGRNERHGAQLWFVGTDTAKDYLANRWRVKSGPGQIHFSQDLSEDFFRQITSEYRVTVWKHGHRLSRWDKKQADRNEALDLMVYNCAAAQYAGLHKLTDAHWDKMAAALNPDQISLFVNEAASAPVTTIAVSDDLAKPDYTPVAEQAAPPHINHGRVTLAGLRRFS
ncbi:phage terminase large subunit family protein [Rhodoferax sp. U2-2l]|uniref:phage terminase large subunit family protein n=1 Tax=Rhodoferax sp. U2-2l TaxID=2884000 RepID=UPI001D0B201B|nr:phage terminase large subunit family protein [Rhodoferax sp. U2-2l]MCB8747709.1 phage terminase large subunit family protein [Rhodoferax sp. U2-2l]